MCRRRDPPGLYSMQSTLHSSYEHVRHLYGWQGHVVVAAALGRLCVHGLFPGLGAAQSVVHLLSGPVYSRAMHVLHSFIHILTTAGSFIRTTNYLVVQFDTATVS